MPRPPEETDIGLRHDHYRLRCTKLERLAACRMAHCYHTVGFCLKPAKHLFVDPVVFFRITGNGCPITTDPQNQLP